MIPLPVSTPEPETSAGMPAGNEAIEQSNTQQAQKPPLQTESPPINAPQEQTQPPPIEEAPLDRSNRMLMVAASILLGVITITAFSLTAWFKTSERFRTVSAPSPAPVPTVPAATMTPAPQRSTVSLEVLNGSGVAGTAKKAADQLGALGYIIVKTGNAPLSTYQSTIVSVAPGQSAITALLLSDLSSLSYTATAGGDLSDSTASARIIIGKK